MWRVHPSLGFCIGVVGGDGEDEVVVVVVVHAVTKKAKRTRKVVRMMVEVFMVVTIMCRTSSGCGEFLYFLVVVVGM